MSANTTTVVTNAYGAELKFIPSVLNSYHNNLEELFAQDKFLDYNSSERQREELSLRQRNFIIVRTVLQMRDISFYTQKII